MGKYEALETDVFSVFGSPLWVSEGVKTFPANFLQVSAGSEFIRVSVIPSGGGLNANSVSGQLLVDIFISVGNGPRRAALIADKLDRFLLRKSLATASGSTTQLFASSLTHSGIDSANPSLHRSIYSISFKHFGVS